MRTRLIAFCLSLLALPACAVAEQPANETLRLVFVGDVLLAGQAGRIMQRQGTAYPLAKVSSILRGADVAFCNLECALTGKRVTSNSNVRQGKRKLFIFKTPAKLGQALVDGGIDVVSLANNHAMNGGQAGLLETMRALDRLSVVFTGAGRNLKQARSSRALKAKGYTIAFLAYTDVGGPGATKRDPGLALLRTGLPTVLKEIKAARRRADVVVVSYHWGVERRTKPSARQQAIARQSIDAGADLVIGHHPHVLQPVMVYKGKTIAYSLGNFVFDSPRPISCRTAILQVEIDADGKQKIEQIPCRIKNAQPNPMPAGQTQASGGTRK